MEAILLMVMFGVTAYLVKGEDDNNEEVTSIDDQELLAHILENRRASALPEQEIIFVSAE
ncbi:hypothetical protein [Thaumasiovibrio subtropicus]|uniref:hypothetical protein n=1 Tax=Thaumasiovibrio subtropicus TaxID=1891207 RepID=UPI00131CCB6D|nr:hypothetical protein [Thaumasiovibrio subtropicus]